MSQPIAESSQEPMTPTTDTSDGGTTAAPARPDAPKSTPQKTPREAPPRTDRLPPWCVFLHNDDVNEFTYVADAVMSLTPLRRSEAIMRTLEAHHTGLTLLLTTHREHAELLTEQFKSKRLTVTIEPAP